MRGQAASPVCVQEDLEWREGEDRKGGGKGKRGGGEGKRGGGEGEEGEGMKEEREGRNICYPSGHQSTHKYNILDIATS